MEIEKIEEELLEKGFHLKTIRNDGLVTAIHKHKNEHRTFKPTVCPKCENWRLVSMSNKKDIPVVCKPCRVNNLKVPGVWWGKKKEAEE